MNKNFIKENYNHYNSEYKFSLKGNNFNKYLLNQINHQGLNTILHYEDISSMQQSIEIRSPFMDYRLMEFAFSIPNELKFKNGLLKSYREKRLVKCYLILLQKNRKKIGFNTPFTDYISNDPRFSNLIFLKLLIPKAFSSKKSGMQTKSLKYLRILLNIHDFPFWRVINL